MRTLWTRIVTLLRDGAAVGTLAPIEPTAEAAERQIVRGEFKSITLRPPFVIAFLEPGTPFTEAGPTGLGTYTATLFCGAPPSPNGTSPETLITSVDMAYACVDLLAPLGPSWPDQSITFDTVQADFAATRLTCILYE